jgi:hypothetical protein
MDINSHEILSIEVLETKFDPAGCENCANNLATDVRECSALFSVNGMLDSYTVNLCEECCVSYMYAECLPDNCKNRFRI